MNKIPPKLKKKILADPYYKHCAREDTSCNGRITFEHAFLYAGKQVQEFWAIIPLCEFHHLGAGLNKRMNEVLAVLRASREDLEKYPRKNWAQIRAYEGFIY